MNVFSSLCTYRDINRRLWYLYNNTQHFLGQMRNSRNILKLLLNLGWEDEKCWIWGSHGGDNEGYGLLVLIQRSSERGRTNHLHFQGWKFSKARNWQEQVASWAYFLILQMKVICSSETSGSLWTTWHYSAYDSLFKMESGCNYYEMQTYCHSSVPATKLSRINKNL